MVREAQATQDLAHKRETDACAVDLFPAGAVLMQRGVRSGRDLCQQFGVLGWRNLGGRPERGFVATLRRSRRHCRQRVSERQLMPKRRAMSAALRPASAASSTCSRSSSEYSGCFMPEVCHLTTRGRKDSDIRRPEKSRMLSGRSRRWLVSAVEVVRLSPSPPAPAADPEMRRQEQGERP